MLDAVSDGGGVIDLSAISRWTPSAQDRALELYKQRIRNDHKPFYCTRPGCNGLEHDDWQWRHARADQHPPPLSDTSWAYWAILAGRAAGKTRAASEMVHKMAMSGKYERIALVARTGPDGRETMVEGASSGLLATAPVNGLPDWAPSTKRLTWPNGCIGTVFSAEEPDRLRGPQHAFCFVAGTMVATANGQAPIEQVATGQLVQTRRGLRRVIATGSRLAEVAVLRHEGGQLTGTLDHPVWTQRGWVELALVQPGDILSVWTGDPTRLAASTATAPAGSSTETATPGSRPTAPCRLAGMSTTGTGIGPTTRSPISRPSRRRRIAQFMQRDRSHADAVSAAPSLPSQDTAVPLPIAGNAGALSPSDRAGRLSSVAGPSRRSALTAGSSSSPVLVDSVVSGASTSGLVMRVYNLTVEDVPEYFADGVLVHNCWLDEAAHMPLIEDVWSNLKLGLRLGRFPRVIITTTPLPTKWIKDLIVNPRTLVTRTSSRANLANLSESFEQDTIIPLEGTRLGRQEINGEILSDVPGALWTADLIENARYNPELIPLELMEEIVVAIDPAGTSTRRSDETGIVVLGRIGDQVYVLADYSGKYSPVGWANRVVAAFELFGANKIVAEKNYGGDLVESNLRHVDQTLPIEMVTSRRGKVLRAEPIVTTYEQGKVHHPMRGLGLDRTSPLEVLEDQMISWVAGTESPDRLDALVHGATYLTRGSGLIVMASGSYRSPNMAGSHL